MLHPLNEVEKTLFAEVRREIAAYATGRLELAARAVIATRGGKGRIVAGEDGEPAYDDGVEDVPPVKKRGRPKKAQAPAPETPPSEG